MILRLIQSPVDNILHINSVQAVTDLLWLSCFRTSAVGIVIWLICPSHVSLASVSWPCSRQLCPRKLWTHSQVRPLSCYWDVQHCGCKVAFVPLFVVVPVNSRVSLVLKMSWRKESAWDRRKQEMRNAERSGLKSKRTRSRGNVSRTDEITAFRRFRKKLLAEKSRSVKKGS